MLSKSKVILWVLFIYLYETKCVKLYFFLKKPILFHKVTWKDMKSLLLFSNVISLRLRCFTLLTIFNFVMFFLEKSIKIISILPQQEQPQTTICHPIKRNLSQEQDLKVHTNSYSLQETFVSVTIQPQLALLHPIIKRWVCKIFIYPAKFDMRILTQIIIVLDHASL